MKKFKRFVAVAIVCTMVISGMVACGKDPKETVLDSFSTLTSSASAQGIIKELGAIETIEGMKEKSFKVGMELKLDETDLPDLEMLETGSLFTEILCDQKAKKSRLDFGVGYSGSDIVSGQLYIDDKQLAVAVPELMDKVFYVEYDNIINELKDSALLNMIGIPEDELSIIEESIDAIKEALEEVDVDEAMSFLTGFEKEIEQFKEEIEVEEIEADKFEINGKERKCAGYEVVITEDAMIDLVEAAIEYYFLSDDAKDFYESLEEQADEAGIYLEIDDIYYMIEELEEDKDEYLDSIDEYISDIEIEMYIYDGEIVMLEAETTITDPEGSFGEDGFEVGVELECTGGEYSVYDNYELAIKVMGMTMVKIEKESETDDDEYTVELKLSGAAIEEVTAGCEFTIDKKDGDFEFVLGFGNEYETIEVTAEGILEVEKKKSVKVEFDELTFRYTDIYWEETNSITLSGECYIECDIDVSMPKGDKFNLLTDKMSDLEGLIEDLQGVMESLENLDFGF